MRGSMIYAQRVTQRQAKVYRINIPLVNVPRFGNIQIIIKYSDYFTLYSTY